MSARADLPQPCPHCETAGSLELTIGMRAQPYALASLAGTRVKFSPRSAALLACRACGWFVHGHLEDARLNPDGFFTSGSFVADEPPIAPQI